MIAKKKKRQVSAEYEARKRKSKELFQSMRRTDLQIIISVIFLSCFGLLMVYSASYYSCSISSDAEYDGAYLFKKQLIFTIFGIAAMILFQYIDYHVLANLSWILYIGSLIAIGLLKSPLGVESNGATRWLNIAGVSVQVGEISKICTIILITFLISKYRGKVRNAKLMIWVWAVTLIQSVLIYMISSNLSTALIIMMIGFSFTFVCCKKELLHVFLGILAVIASIGAAKYFLNNLPSQAELSAGSYRIGRFIAWVAPEKYPDTVGYQVLQGLYAVGTGGLFGKGLGQGVQKLSAIPESQNDMIFSIVCEELGIFGGVCLLLMFGYMLYQMMIVAQNSEDIFGALLSCGIMFHFAYQILVNVAVTLNMIPNTGVSLPLISSGGTSVLFTMIEIGIVLSVRRFHMNATVVRSL